MRRAELMIRFILRGDLRDYSETAASPNGAGNLELASGEFFPDAGSTAVSPDGHDAGWETISPLPGPFSMLEQVAD